MCQAGSGPSGQGHQGPMRCNCGCCGCGCGLGFRRFFSAAEQLECLQAYIDQLKKEQAGVEERIKELRSQS